MKLMKRNKQKVQPLAPVARAWAPVWPLSRLQNEIDRLFEESFDSWLAPFSTPLEAWVPAVDIFEDKNNIVVKTELPGMKKEEIEVYMTGEALNIAGERKEETEHKSGQAFRVERYFGRFHRTVPLPVPVQQGKIQANYKDGVLTIVCPKTEEAKRKQVEIKFE
jgi:HSP20 family protein